MCRLQFTARYFRPPWKLPGLSHLFELGTFPPLLLPRLPVTLDFCHLDVQGKKKGYQPPPSVGPFAGVEPWVYFDVGRDVRRPLEEVSQSVRCTLLLLLLALLSDMMPRFVRLVLSCLVLSVTRHTERHGNNSRP